MNRDPRIFRLKIVFHDLYGSRKMVVPYMKDELSPTELEDFLDHIKTCENCRKNWRSTTVDGWG